MTVCSSAIHTKHFLASPLPLLNVQLHSFTPKKLPLIIIQPVITLPAKMDLHIRQIVCISTVSVVLYKSRSRSFLEDRVDITILYGVKFHQGTLFIFSAVLELGRYDEYNNST